MELPTVVQDKPEMLPIEIIRCKACGRNMLNSVIMLCENCRALKRRIRDLNSKGIEYFAKELDKIRRQG